MRIGWQKEGTFWEKFFQTRLSRPSLSRSLSETVNIPVVDQLSSKLSSVGSISGTMLKCLTGCCTKAMEFFFIISQLMMKVLKVLGHPRRRGVPANPPPSPLQIPPPPPPF